MSTESTVRTPSRRQGLLALVLLGTLSSTLDGVYAYSSATAPVEATGLAAHFSAHITRLQLISIPGQWNGFNGSTAVTVEVWVKMTNYLQERAPLFMYSVRDPLGGSVSAKELGLEIQLDPLTRNVLPAWRYKGKLLYYPYAEELQQSDILSSPAPPQPTSSIGDATPPPPPASGWPNRPQTGDIPSNGTGRPAGTGIIGGFGNSDAPRAGAPAWAQRNSSDGRIRDGCIGIFKCGYWNHIVATFDFVSGEYAVYLNGTEMYGAMLPSHDGPPLAGGVFHLGADILPSGQPSRLMAHQISDFSIDVLRIYDRVLSADEVAEGLWAAEPTVRSAPNLFLDWRFDNPLNDTETDFSGQGNHGQWGVSYDLNYPQIFKLQVQAGVSQDTLVHAPEVVLSSAPARHADAVSALAVPRVPVMLLLTDRTSNPSDTCSLLSLPSIGNVVDLEGFPVAIGKPLPNCTLSYTAPSADEWTVSSLETAYQLLASFHYETTGSNFSRPIRGTVSVYGTAPCEPMQLPRMNMLPFKMYPIALGGTCADGQQAVVEVVSLPAPASGTLLGIDQEFPYALQAVASFGQASTMQPNEAWIASTPVAAITAYPANLSNSAGYALFVTASTLSVSIDTWLDFRWICPFANTDAVSRMLIHVEKTNKPPSSISMEVMQTSSKSSARPLLDLQLLSTDPDGSPHLSASPVLYHITRGPRFGTLHQVNKDGSRGSGLSRYGLSTPKVDYFASSIPPYEVDWGPSWTSQASGCSQCCGEQATCNAPSCMAAGYFHPFCPAISGSFHIENILGEDSSTVYRAGCTACGRQSFVVGFDELMYISGVRLYQYGVAGAVTSLKAAGVYRGSETQWIDLWHAKDEIRVEETWSTKEWSPRLCPYFSEPVQWLRVEFDTDSVPSQAVGFVRALAMGSLTPPQDIVHDSEGRLLYEPTAGVFPLSNATEWDDIEVAASDCDLQSERVKLPIDALAVRDLQDNRIFGEPQMVTVPAGKISNVALDLSRAVEHLSRVTREGVHPEDFTLEATIQVRRSRSMVMLEYDDGNLEVDGLIIGTTFFLGAGNTIAVQPRIDMLNESEELIFLATARGVTYRLSMIISAACPDDADMFECAANADICVNGCTDSPTACIDLPYDAVVSYNPAERRCVASVTPIASDAGGVPQNVLIPLVAALSSLVAIALLALLCLKKTALLKIRLGGPPLVGDSVTLVTTDIQGSTSLWDAFPDQVARDIALHHECLRANLKPCSGYEIATEGDSFKCAFGNAEDAICWSVMVQLDLLCAPWSQCLEDGGHGILCENDDWANTAAPQVASDSARRVISALTASDKMEQIRTELAGGALMQPLFAPALIKPSSTDAWDDACGTGAECRVAYGPHSLMLPIFRGPRVRIGIHSGIATSVSTNPVTKRLVYGGQVAEVAKAVSDTPCGGQIVMSSETLAEVRSMQDLSKRVAIMCAGWRHGTAADEPNTPAGISVMSLGSHLLKPASPPKKRAYSLSSMTSPGRLSSEMNASSASFAVGSLFNSGILASNDNSLRGDVPRLRNVTAILPPSLSDTSAFHREEAAMADTEKGGQASVGQESADSALEDEDLSRLAIAQNELQHAQELVMLLPWPLKSRALFFPPLTTYKSLTSPWSCAPAAEDVTIVFTFVDGANALKLALPEEVMAEATQQLQAVVRTALSEHSGYEVEVEEGNFVCAFGSAYDAAAFGMACQVSLMAVEWHPMLLAQPCASEQLTLYSTGYTFRGIRLAIGMCTGNALRVQPCLRTGKMEYYGPIMNHAARIAVAAHGGQVLLHESSWDEIVGGERREPDHAVFVNMGRHTLKGVARKVYIIQALSSELSGRSFPPIKTKSSRGKKAAPIAAGRSMKVANAHLDRYLYDVGALAEAPQEDDEISAAEKGNHSAAQRSLQVRPRRSTSDAKPVRQEEASGWLLKGMAGITSLAHGNRVHSSSKDLNSHLRSPGGGQQETDTTSLQTETAMEEGHAKK